LLTEARIVPSKSKKQVRFMAGCANNPEEMANCPPPKVAKEFAKADSRAAKQDRRRGKNARGK
jgi:hypothetical protein